MKKVRLDAIKLQLKKENIGTLLKKESMKNIVGGAYPITTDNGTLCNVTHNGGTLCNITHNGGTLCPD